MAGIKGDFNKLKKLAEKLEGLAKPVFRAKLSKNIAEESIEMVNQSFEEGRSPYGPKWPAPRWRSANGKVSPLRDTGRLQRSFHVVSTSFYKFVVETNVKYAATHQYGAVIKPKTAKCLVFRGVHTDVGRTAKGRKSYKRTYGGWIFAKKVTIPQRQMMPEPNQGLPNRWKKGFDDTATDVLKAFLGKR